MNIKIILYGRVFFVLIDRVDTSVQQLRFVSITKFVNYILDNSSIRASYVGNFVEIINKIPYRNLAVTFENMLTTALQT